MQGLRYCPLDQLVQPLRIEPHHYVLADHQRRCGPAVISADKLKNILLIRRHVALFEFDTSILEVGLSSPARRSTRLRE